MVAAKNGGRKRYIVTLLIYLLAVAPWSRVTVQMALDTTGYEMCAGSMGLVFLPLLLAALSGKGIRIAVDATKDLLLNVLKYHPFLIKPNHHELGEIFDVTIDDMEKVKIYAGKLQEQGARNVLVSMGGKGAALLTEKGDFCHLPAPEGKLVNSVGAGDSMVAGFLAGWLESGDYVHAFKMGISAGSASAFSENLATKEEVLALYKKLK